MSNYTLNDAKFVKIFDKETGGLIGVLEIGENNVLSTIHNVVAIPEIEYLELKSTSEIQYDN